MVLQTTTATLTASAVLYPHIPVDVNATSALSATALLDPHTIHDLTATLTAKAVGVFWYSSHRSVPANKFMYESDGTSVYYLRADSDGSGNLGPWVEKPITSTGIRQLNGWGTGFYPIDDAYESYQYRFVFPDLRNIDYVLLYTRQDGSVGGNYNYRLYWSSDTTNGEDGTWTQKAVTTYQNLLDATYNRKRYNVYGNYVNLTGVRGIRLFIDHTLSLWPGNEGGRPNQIHFYGSRGQANRLAFWHPTEDREVSGHHFDWENFFYGEDTRQFRIKNVSLTNRAINIQVSMDCTDDPWSPSIDTYHSLYNGDTWNPAISIDALDAEGISSVYTLKRSFYGTSPTWFTMRLIATAGSWYTYIHNLTASLSANAAATGDTVRERNADAALATTAYITDGVIYRNSSEYQDMFFYRGSRTTQLHAATAAITVSIVSDTYPLYYSDTYGGTSLYAEASDRHNTTATMSAGPRGDNYGEIYTDEYGNTGLFAVAS